ncbi:MAG: branched-chain amino acid transport system substrate-binding protein [archaeon GW2011_AR3]|nr:MAG: branched-chain amino acid transport system substrate-binding protein [archaeon GW2011_AR3]MBS3109275.1 penicillin-binding protein activator [Candidatus Woesearchaeota archaeon]
MQTNKLFLAGLAALVILMIGCTPVAQNGVPDVRPANGETETSGEPDAQATTETVKLGLMLPLSGDATAYGNPIRTAAFIAADEINAKGGINGKMIEFVTEDSKCSPKDGASAAQKLVNVDKVKVIIGGACSGETLGAAPITEAAKVILISPSATSPDITAAGDYVFRIAPSDAFAGEVAAKYASDDLGRSKAVVFSETTDYAQGLRKVFKENFELLGGAVVADETFSSEDTDMRTQVLKAKNANPDVIYIVAQTPAKATLLLKQLKESGMEQEIVASEVLLGRDFIAENSELIEGAIGIEPKVDDTSPTTAALFAKYKEQTGEEVPWPQFVAGVYDAVYLVSDAISLYGEDTDKIRDNLYSVKDYNGAIGKLTFDENGDPLLPYSVKKITGGKAVEIATA